MGLRFNLVTNSTRRGESWIFLAREIDAGLLHKPAIPGPKCLVSPTSVLSIHRRFNSLPIGTYSQCLHRETQLLSLPLATPITIIPHSTQAPIPSPDYVLRPSLALSALTHQPLAHIPASKPLHPKHPHYPNPQNLFTSLLD